MNAFRAYFRLKNGLTAGDPSAGVRAFALNFGDEASGIQSLSMVSKDSKDNGARYTLDGRRLSSKPTKSGLYVNNGRKVYVK